MCDTHGAKDTTGSRGWNPQLRAAGYAVPMVASRLEPLTEQVWTVSIPHRMFGIHLGTRMTVVRLPSGGLWLHSPVALDAALLDEVSALGPVEHLVAPNLYHHVYMAPWVEACPDATLHLAPGLEKKRPDLRSDALIRPTADGAPWAEVFDQQRIDGCLLGETVFLHRPSNTLISSDLVENFKTSDHWPTRAYLKVSGIHGKPGLAKILRPMFRDRVASRRSLDVVEAWNFDRIVLAHGRPVMEDAREVLRDTYRWL